MIDKQLLDILCCPETKQGVILADNDAVEKINNGIKAGEIINREGTIVKEIIDAGLVREDGKYMYPIRENIPIMLINEAIVIN